jgi:hypothetical protein
MRNRSIKMTKQKVEYRGIDFLLVCLFQYTCNRTKHQIENSGNLWKFDLRMEWREKIMLLEVPFHSVGPQVKASAPKLR